MANKYLKRRFTLRESILLGVLVVVLLLGLYFGLVFYPIRSRTTKLSDDLARVQSEIRVAEALKKDYDDMKAELARIEATGDQTSMPQYKNNEQQEVLQACFKTVTQGIDARIIYGTPSEPEDGVRTRLVNFTFTIDDTNRGEMTVYEKVKTLLHDLMTTGFRCSMTRLNLDPGNGDLQNDNSVEVSCDINFYELDS